MRGRAIRVALFCIVCVSFAVIGFGVQPSSGNVTEIFLPPGGSFPTPGISCSGYLGQVTSNPFGYVNEIIYSDAPASQGPFNCAANATEGIYQFGFGAYSTTQSVSIGVSFPIPDGSTAFAYAGNSQVADGEVFLSPFEPGSCSSLPGVPGGTECTLPYANQTLTATSAPIGTLDRGLGSSASGVFAPGAPTWGVVTITAGSDTYQTLAWGPPGLPSPDTLFPVAPVPEPSSALLILTGMATLTTKRFRKVTMLPRGGSPRV